MTTEPTEVIARTLDFEVNKVETLQIEELVQTASERNSGGTPVFGVEHHELFSMLMGKMSHLGIDYEVQPIYAADGGAKSLPGVMRLPYLENKYGERALQSWLIRRIIGAIHLRYGENNESIGSIGISFHQQGIQISYGQMIKLCANMCIMGTRNVISTYGDDNKITSIDKMIEVVGDWVQDHQVKRDRDLRIFENMKQIPMSYPQTAELIGDMNIMRVNRDILRTGKNYALNQGQISQFTEKYVKAYRNNPEDADNLWKLYNMATEFHKPGETEITQIIPNNVTLSDFMIKKFQLDN
mgnify:CR=1 FL=1